jgi:hypothetical protein
LHDQQQQARAINRVGIFRIYGFLGAILMIFKFFLDFYLWSFFDAEMRADLDFFDAENTNLPTLGPRILAIKLKQSIVGKFQLFNFFATFFQAIQTYSNISQQSNPIQTRSRISIHQTPNYPISVYPRDRRRAGPVPVFSGPGPGNRTFSDPPGFSGLRFFPVLPGPGPDCLPSEFSGFLGFFPGFSGLNFMSYSLKFDSF